MMVLIEAPVATLEEVNAHRKSYQLMYGLNKSNWAERNDRWKEYEGDDTNVCRLVTWMILDGTLGDRKVRWRFEVSCLQASGRATFRRGVEGSG